MMRALCFGFPDDRAVWDFPFEYQLGDDLLVAPVCHEGADYVAVYLPGRLVGRRVDRPRHEGPGTLRRPVPLDEIASYVPAGRAAALVPAFAELPGSLGSGRVRDAADPHRQQAAHPGDQPGDRAQHGAERAGRVAHRHRQADGPRAARPCRGSPPSWSRPGCSSSSSQPPVPDGPTGRRAGRRPVLLSLNAAAGFAVGVKITERQVIAVLTDLDANGRRPPRSGPAPAHIDR